MTLVIGVFNTPAVWFGFTPMPSSVMIADVSAGTRNSSAAYRNTEAKGAASGTAIICTKNPPCCILFLEVVTLYGSFGSLVSVILNVTFPVLAVAISFPRKAFRKHKTRRQANIRLSPIPTHTHTQQQFSHFFAPIHKRRWDKEAQGGRCKGNISITGRSGSSLEKYRDSKNK